MSALSKDGSTLPLQGRGNRSSGPVDGPTHCLRIVVCAGPDTGRAFELDKEVLVLGRGETADVPLTDPAVSQFHMEVSLAESGVRLLDLGSLNGVWFGGARIERGIIPIGALISLGQTTVRLESNQSQAAQWPMTTAFGHLIGKSPAMLSLFHLLSRLAGNDLPIILQGPTGSGKEEIARALHAQSRRAAGPFAVLDCTVIPESLAESILFGHERGAFTGAHSKRIGMFEAAHGGVLFIDEIGELPLSIQPMLLRALEKREVTPVGATRSRAVDIRIVAATWRDLRAMVNQGTFREDLYYRLAGAMVPVPALSDRVEDIPLLAAHFLSVLAPNSGAAQTIQPDALHALCKRPFSGNVRELRLMVERLAHLAEGPSITVADVEMESILAGLRTRSASHPTNEPWPSRATGAESVPLFKEAKRTAIDEFERHYLERLMNRANSNITQAAALAGIERHNLRTLLKKHDLYRGE